MWGLSDVLPVPTHGNVVTVRTRLPIPTHLDFASPIHCSRLFTHLRWSFSSKFDIIRTTAKTLLAYIGLCTAGTLWIVHAGQRRTAHRPTSCIATCRQNALSFVTHGVQHNAHCILSPGFDVGAMCRPSVCWRHRQVSLPDYLCHLKLCFTVSYVLFSSSALHCFFLSETEITVHCLLHGFLDTHLLIHSWCDIARNRVGDVTGRWRRTIVKMKIYRRFLSVCCLFVNSTTQKKLLSDFNDIRIVHCGPESSWLNFRKVSSIVILVLS